jgi:hypothetical protein
MIVYDLHCDSGHHFEGWFSHADDYAEQAANGLLSCPVCSSAEICKVPTASHVRTQMAPSAKNDQPTAERMPDQVQALQALRQYIGENFADVGSGFPEEARKIHYGESEPRNIRGVASHDEFKALRDEGVEVRALPPILDKGKLN